MGVTGWLLLAFIFGIVAWTSRDQLWNLFSGILPVSAGTAKTPRGEWVGEMMITVGYDPATMDNKPYLKVRVPAALHFELSIQDSFLGDYGGEGELYIAGEKKSRPLHLGAFSVWKADNSLHAAFVTPHLNIDVNNGHFSPTEITLESNDPVGVQFHATLHRGGVAEYQRLVEKIRQSKPIVENDDGTENMPVIPKSKTEDPHKEGNEYGR